jgi:hypothetical protein
VNRASAGRLTNLPLQQPHRLTIRHLANSNIEYGPLAVGDQASEDCRVRDGDKLACYTCALHATRACVTRQSNVANPS